MSLDTYVFSYFYSVYSVILCLLYVYVDIYVARHLCFFLFILFL